MGTRHLYWILNGASLAVHSSIVRSLSTTPNMNLKYSVVDPDPHGFLSAGSGSGYRWPKVNPQKRKIVRKCIVLQVPANVPFCGVEASYSWTVGRP
jgi:hypothetical protein